MSQMCWTECCHVRWASARLILESEDRTYCSDCQVKKISAMHCADSVTNNVQGMYVNAVCAKDVRQVTSYQFCEWLFIVTTNWNSKLLPNCRLNIIFLPPNVLH